MQLQNATPASKDLVELLGSITHCKTSSPRRITSTTEYCYRDYNDMKTNDLTLENEKLTEENESMTNDMIALSHEFCELEHEFSLERNANEQLARTIDALSHECEELVEDSLKHQPSSITTENNKNTFEMQQMKQKLKHAAEERKLLEERVAALERESTNTDSYIRFLEGNSTESPAMWGKTRGRSSRWTTLRQNEENVRSSKSLSDLPESFPPNLGPTASSSPTLPLLAKRGGSSNNGGGKYTSTNEVRRSRRGSLVNAVSFCKSALPMPRNNPPCFRHRDGVGAEIATAGRSQSNTQTSTSSGCNKLRRRMSSLPFVTIT
jgi:hypothetical protein